VSVDDRAWRLQTMGLVCAAYGLTTKEFWKLPVFRHAEMVAALFTALAASMPETEPEPEPETEGD
jgi:hypothetical protein